MRIWASADPRPAPQGPARAEARGSGMAGGPAQAIVHCLFDRLSQCRGYVNSIEFGNGGQSSEASGQSRRYIRVQVDKDDFLAADRAQTAAVAPEVRFAHLDPQAGKHLESLFKLSCGVHL